MENYKSKIMNILSLNELIELFGEDISSKSPSIKELSEGNINYIFLVEYQNKNCIIKFAGKKKRKIK